MKSPKKMTKTPKLDESWAFPNFGWDLQTYWMSLDFSKFILDFDFLSAQIGAKF